MICRWFYLLINNFPLFRLTNGIRVEHNWVITECNFIYFRFDLNNQQHWILFQNEKHCQHIFSSTYIFELHSFDYICLPSSHRVFFELNVFHSPYHMNYQQKKIKFELLEISWNLNIPTFLTNRWFYFSCSFSPV